MKVELVVDGKTLSLNVSSDKPLSELLREDVEIKSLESCCHGDMCGKCIVLLNGKAVLSCLIPAFNVKNATVVTYDSFSKTKDFKDIENAYISLGVEPCVNCYASRTLLIENILRRYEEADLGDNALLDENMLNEIMRENELIKCFCMDMNSFIEIVKESLNNRRKRNVNVYGTKIS
ncbi:MAG: 2Fe-2S iron-sulfur cluster binding domain-containing protein [Sphaerochaetaceae bacterium]|nr:2Fe-2S iron-sulfur cluster binding domain-containing protein [Sphaerochaetaceae bacterium]